MSLENTHRQVCRRQDLPLPCPAPEEYVLFSREQYASPGFRYQPLSPESPINWLPVRNETISQPTFAPAALVLFPYKKKKDEIRISSGVSTGLALGSSPEEALLKGVYEVLERDALALAWNWSVPVKRIAPGSFLRSLQERVKLGPECSVHAFYLTQDIAVPIAAVFVCRKEQEGYRLTVGSAARFTLREAVEKAFLEAIQGMPYVRGLRKMFQEWREVKTFNEITSFQHSAVFYSKFPHFLGERLTTGQFLNSSGEFTLEELEGNDPAISAEKTQLNYCLDALAKYGYQTLSFDLTADRLRSHDLYAYRALVPGLLGLEGVYEYRYRDPRRAQTLAGRMNISYQENNLPHPLP